MRLNFTHDGIVYVDAQPDLLAERGVPAEAILAAAKVAACEQIDAAAEVARLTFITPGAGQAMEYQEAITQAVSALDAAAAGRPVSAEEYPMLAATIGLDRDPSTGAAATDVLGVARAVKAGYAAFAVPGAAIRGLRLSAKAAIDAAGTLAAIEAAARVAFPAR